MPRILVGAAATAVANNTQLLAGDLGITNEGGVKVGPGLWNSLPYLGAAVPVNETAFLSLTGGAGPGGAFNVGDTATASFVPGVKGVLTFTRDGADIAGSASTGPVSSHTYLVASADGAKLLDVRASGLVFATGGSYVVGSADTSVPGLVGPYISNDERDTVALEFYEPLNTAAPPASAFALAGVVSGAAKTVVSVGVTNTAERGTVKVKYSSDFIGTDEPTIAYAVPAGNSIRDVAGNPAAAIGALAVFNQIPKPITLLVPDDGGYESSTPGTFLHVDDELYFGRMRLPGTNSFAWFTNAGHVQFNCDYSTPNKETGIGVGITSGTYITANPAYVLYKNGVATLYSQGVAEATYAFPSPAAPGNRSALFWSPDDGVCTFAVSLNGGSTWTNVARCSMASGNPVLLVLAPHSGGPVTGVGALGAQAIYG